MPEGAIESVPTWVADRMEAVQPGDPARTETMSQWSTAWVSLRSTTSDAPDVTNARQVVSEVIAVATWVSPRQSPNARTMRSARMTASPPIDRRHGIGGGSDDTFDKGSREGPVPSHASGTDGGVLQRLGRLAK